MRILQITPQIFPKISVQNNRNSCNAQVSPAVSKPDSFVHQGGGGIHFTSKYPCFITSQPRFRELAKGGRETCIWCGNRMFVQSELDFLENVCLKTAKDAKEFSETLLAYENYFPENRAKLLKNISDFADFNPGLDLKTTMKKMHPYVEKDLIHEQYSVFEELEKESAILPPKVKAQFDELVTRSKYRIAGIPYVSEYSAKEFNYQLNVLLRGMSDNSAKKYKTLAELLIHPIFKEEDGMFPERLLDRFYKQAKINPSSKGNYISPKDEKAKEKMQFLILNKIEDFAAKQKLEDIVELCTKTKDKILGKPVTVQFSNKAFRFKLGEILKQTGDEKLEEKFIRISEKLPTSVNDENAFVVKYKNAPLSKIIHNVLVPSRVTIEHLTPILRHTTEEELKIINAGLPKSKRLVKGENEIGNWALACSYCNGIHGSANIKGEMFPFSVQAGKDYFKHMVEDANSGLLSGESVVKMARNYRKQTGLKVNLKGLVYTTDTKY